MLVVKESCCYFVYVNGTSTAWSEKGSTEVIGKEENSGYIRSCASRHLGSLRQVGGSVDKRLGKVTLGFCKTVVGKGPHGMSSNIEKSTNCCKSILD